MARKTSAGFRCWVGSDERSVCVAVHHDEGLAAVGVVAWRGEILLNHRVHPTGRTVTGTCDPT
ncbi:hypothetical protein EXY23_25630 [Roseicella aquatilis]|uniref:Uncharacterized protein n=1 Tax=Roseicella aquatilis TaxID=2527868 RepID=A0A4R4D547_9PROT|nr:hypothetical protein EXY23_25630 [Roseicella aquatilis]